jgi:hypothetical protein
VLAAEDPVDSVVLLGLEAATGGDRVAFFWGTRDEVVDESGVADDLVTMEDVVDATDCDTTTDVDVVVEDDVFRAAVDFAATTGVGVGFVATGAADWGLGSVSLGSATHDEMSEDIRSATVSTTSVDENER